LRAVCYLLPVLVLLAAPKVGAAERAGGVLWEVSEPLPDATVVVPRVFDADGDGLPDLLLTSVGRNGPWWITALDGASGNVLWSRRHRNRPAVCAVPVDRGGSNVFVADSTRAMLLNGADGEVVVTAELPAWTGPAAAGDFDGDGSCDVVVAVGTTRDDRLLALSGSDLSAFFSAAAEEDDSKMGTGFSDPVLCDADGDGSCEVYVTENTDRLTRFDAQEGRAWSVRLDERGKFFPKGAITGRPVAVDVDGSGESYLCVGCLAGRLVLVDPSNGEVVGSHRFGVRSESDMRRLSRLPRFMRRAIADSGEPVNRMAAVELDGSAGMELVFGCGDGRVYAYSPARGELIWSLDSGSTVYEPPIPADMNGDGTPDLIAWQYRDALFIDGGTGESMLRPPALGGPELADPTAVMLEDLDGDGMLEGVLVEHAGLRVIAWRTSLPVGGVEARP